MKPTTALIALFLLVIALLGLSTKANNPDPKMDNSFASTEIQDDKQSRVDAGQPGIWPFGHSQARTDLNCTDVFKLF